MNATRPDPAEHCWYCGDPADVFDHIMPRSRGGTNQPDNLRPCCNHCNVSKSNKTTEQHRDRIILRQAAGKYLPDIGWSLEQIRYLISKGFIDSGWHEFHGEKKTNRTRADLA